MWLFCYERRALFAALGMLVLTGCANNATPLVAPAAPEPYRVLLAGDPFAIAIQKSLPVLEAQLKRPIVLELVSYDAMRQMTLLNARDQVSAYDVVSVDGVWLGEYATQRVLLPLRARVALSATLVQPEDFLPQAYQQSIYQGELYGLPIQSHPELLWYHRPPLQAAGLPPPTTTDDLLAAAAVLTRPERNQYGLCWNGQRGQALGQQMAHFYAAFGQPLLDAQGRPTLNTPQGVAAARYAQALLPYSPPDVLNMAWDRRPSRFAQGGCAMTYEWAARSDLVENPTSPVAGQVGYLPAPHAPGQAPVTPLGTWSLSIPANIGPRADAAWVLLAYLTRADTAKLLATNGNGGMARLSLLQDSALARLYPAFTTVAALAEQNQLADWMRPTVPQWPALADILGTVYHDMLQGLVTPEQAAAEAQRQAVGLFP